MSDLLKKIGIAILLLNFGVAIAASTEKYDFVVDQNGTGNFKTVQEAINAVPDFRKTQTTIFIKNGVYKEKLVLAGSKRNVKFIGENVNKTILTYDDWAQKKNTFGEEKGTSGSSSFYVYGDGFSAENISFQNTSGPVGQAVAIWVASDKAFFKNCRFLGFQDTLYTFGKGSRQYYKDCYIEGTVDFIFGSSTAWFENCDIFCKKSGYITAASTPDTLKYGYVFNKCRIVGEGEGSFYLGRPWRPFAKTVFMNCDMGKVIKAEGWNNWGKESNEKTTYYAEYNNRGPGFSPSKRVTWAHILNDEQAKEYTLFNVMSGWQPE
ncbi:pectinesterase family protein [Desertivirga xinjiangensis]|uniref:pectinesterase family protein n=1 Tax=Desertivirga xinjiangensis TaxID=539206 RepID=UPI00210C93A9|nr:pectinesterase family protein [Pedobacter xinjiangensis]